MKDKTFRIRPGIHLNSKVWVLEEKKKGWDKWKPTYESDNINAVRRMKNHLLLPEKIYTSKNNVVDEKDPDDEEENK
jgi:hypothetical protein